MDVEFSVGAGEVVADGFGGDEQRRPTSRLPIALGGEPGDPQFTGGQGVHAGGPGSAGAGAGGQRLLAGALQRAVWRRSGEAKSRARREGLAGDGACPQPRRNAAPSSVSECASSSRIGRWVPARQTDCSSSSSIPSLPPVSSPQTRSAMLIARGVTSAAGPLKLRLRQLPGFLRPVRGPTLGLVLSARRTS